MSASRRAGMEFSLTWCSEAATHLDRLFVAGIDVENGVPGIFSADDLRTLAEGQLRAEIPAGKMIADHDPGKVEEIGVHQFVCRHAGLQITPRVGRFYPPGFYAAAGHSGHPDSLPFRILKIDENRMVIDRNHALAGYPLVVKATPWNPRDFPLVSAHNRQDIALQITANGPGMQSPAHGIGTDFYSTYPFERDNADDDAVFYRRPRLIQHLDDMALQQVNELYTRLIRPGSTVLDLMSGYLSHLAGIQNLYVTGLGMNGDEMERNSQLADHLLHDLNGNAEIPFADNRFDAVICTSSVEYLVDPFAVFAQVARVLRPGGIFVVVFSDRWFASKEIQLWSELHPFERLGLVLDLMARSPGLENLQTETLRGLPRPRHDRYAGRRKHADPIFAVWGFRKG